MAESGDRTQGGGEVDVEGRRLRLTNLDKVMYPATGLTKAGVIDYYARIAEAILPHLRNRPLTRVRYPDGVEGSSFFEKRCPEHRPDWVRTVSVFAGRRVGEVEFCVCDDRATLVWLAQLAALELHPSLSLAADVERPTVLAFDLDPGAPATIAECCAVALRLRELLGELGLRCFPKTSGSKGLQVYVPLNREVGYERTKPFAHAVARLLEREAPERVVSRMARSLRDGKVFVDWSQNDRSKTTVAVYSLRARDRPTVSTPLAWEEVGLGARGEHPEDVSFEADAVLERVSESGDAFAPVLELEQELPELGSGAG